MKPNGLPDSVSAAVLADLIGVSPRSITDLAKRGIVVRATAGKGFDLRLSLRGYADHQRKLATGRGGESAINTATAQRTRLPQEQADAAALKNKRERGELLDAGEDALGRLRGQRRARQGAKSRAAVRLMI